MEEGEIFLTDQREQRATIALWTLPGVGPRTVGRVRARFGSIAAAIEQDPDAIVPELPSAARPFANRLARSEQIANEVLGSTESIGGQIVFEGAPGWPRQLTGVPDAPPLLFVRGSLSPAGARVGIVGARKTDDYGQQVSSYLGRELAAAGVGIVSGGAIGVDSAAHAAAVEVGQTTVVLGCGVDVVYPRLNRKLFDRILMHGGALVSTFPPRTPPCEQNFPVRNRVLAALCDALVVTRAGRESGALMTARAAHKLGRPVLGVSGRIGEEQSRGVTLLIRDGVAIPADGPEDILKALGRPSSARSSAPRRTAPSRPPIPPQYQRVMAVLEAGPSQMDEIAAASGLTIPALASALTELEMLGLCEVRLGGLFAATGGPEFDCATEPV